MKEFIPEKIFYEPAALSFPLGKQLIETYLPQKIPMEAITAHANLTMLKQDIANYKEKKRSLSLRIRHIHYLKPSRRTGSFHVSHTSSGCPALCLTCPLLQTDCSSAFLQLFVNREEIMGKLLQRAAGLPSESVFDIGQDSDLVIENTITDNLSCTIREFCAQPKGRLCFATRFCQIDPLLPLPHQGRVIPQMNINPDELIWQTEFGTSHLAERIEAVNKLCEADYPTELCIAPILLIDGWQSLYDHFLEQLAAMLSFKARQTVSFSVRFLTYYPTQEQLRFIAFPGAIDILDPSTMTGQQFYRYRKELRRQAESFFLDRLTRYFPENRPIILP
ncbi:MAG: spore photoproduct lyase [Clostridiales bacterium]|nr:spore photoproduct lyase [Clostridiales bacterium]